MAIVWLCPPDSQLPLSHACVEAIREHTFTIALLAVSFPSRCYPRFASLHKGAMGSSNTVHSSLMMFTTWLVPNMSVFCKRKYDKLE